MPFPLYIQRKIPFKVLWGVAFFLHSSTAFAQSTAGITLEQCYKLAESNYPLSRQRGLIAKTEAYTLENLAKGIYPQLAVDGAATYQSDVTNLAVPGFISIKIPKDQYGIYGELSQTISDFGINKQNRELSRTAAALQEENLNTQLFALKDRINQLFFGVLLIDGQLKQNELSEQDIQTGMAKVQTAIHNGTDFRSSLNKLKAELLKTDQHSIDLSASRRAYLDMLSLFIHQAIDDSTPFIKPSIPILIEAIDRPELRAYDLQKQSYLEQQRLMKLSTYPHLSAFFRGGLARPSPLNLLAQDLTPYYITGIRLDWTIGGLYTYRKERLINANNQEVVLTERNTFLFNTTLTLHQQDADITRYRKFVLSDNDIIGLRDSVKQTSALQLQNGVISVNDYLLDIRAASEARQDRVVHEIQLLLSQYAHKTTTGH